MKKTLFSALAGIVLSLVNGYHCLGQEIDIGDATNFLKSLVIAPGGTLTMNLDRGGVQITGADQNTVQIRVQRKVTRAGDSDVAEILRDEHVVIKQTGNQISITSQDPFHLGFFSGWHRPNLQVDYEIIVPRQFDARVQTDGGGVKLAGLQGDATVETEGGGLEFKDMHGNIDGQTEGGGIYAGNCTGDVKVRTEGGGLHFKDINGNVDAQTEGGGVYAGNCNGDLQLKTEGGSIRIEEFSGSGVHASTEGGSVSAGFVAAPKLDSEFQSEGGSVRVRLPDNAAITLDAHTDGGWVNTELPVQVEGKHSRDTLKGTVNGGGPMLRLETEGGNIELLKQ